MFSLALVIYVIKSIHVHASYLHLYPFLASQQPVQWWYQVLWQQQPSKTVEYIPEIRICDSLIPDPTVIKLSSFYKKLRQLIDK